MYLHRPIFKSLFSVTDNIPGILHDWGKILLSEVRKVSHMNTSYRKSSYIEAYFGFKSGGDLADKTDRRVKEKLTKYTNPIRTGYIQNIYKVIKSTSYA